jgi:hypothetical protein
MGGGVRDLLLAASFKAAARSQSRRKHITQSERQSHIRLHHAVGSGSHISGALRKWSIRSSGRPRSLSCASASRFGLAEHFASHIGEEGLRVIPSCPRQVGFTAVAIAANAIRSHQA